MLKPNTMFFISLIKERRGEREDIQEFHLKVLHIKEILSISCMMYPAQLSAGLGFLEPDFATGMHPYIHYITDDQLVKQFVVDLFLPFTSNISTYITIINHPSLQLQSGK